MFHYCTLHTIEDKSGHTRIYGDQIEVSQAECMALCYICDCNVSFYDANKHSCAMIQCLQRAEQPWTIRKQLICDSLFGHTSQTHHYTIQILFLLDNCSRWSLWLVVDNKLTWTGLMLKLWLFVYCLYVNMIKTKRSKLKTLV